MPEEIQTAQAGEQTTAQVAERTGPGSLASFMSDGSTLAAPDPATYKTFREMRKNPTIALARAVATAPIRTAQVGYEVAEGFEVPPDRLEFVSREMKSIWVRLVADMSFGLDYGWAPFEIVYTMKNDLIGFDRIKPLLVDKTVAVADKETGRFAGLKQGEVTLPLGKSFIYTHDQEADDVYGRSRHENVREDAWTLWKDLSKRQLQFAKKIATVIPLLHYPVGESPGKGGDFKDNFEHAQRMLREMGEGAGIAMPNNYEAWVEDIGKVRDPEKLRSWIIDIVEVKGNHLAELSASMRHMESLMMRGWLVPERTAIEGQLGTKAEAGVHGELALIIAELTLREMLAAVNAQLINCLLLLNYGPEAMDSIVARTMGLDPITRLFFVNVAEKILSLPDIALQINSLTDFDQVLRELGLPPPVQSETEIPLSRDADSFLATTLRSQVARAMREGDGGAAA